MEENRSMERASKGLVSSRARESLVPVRRQPTLPCPMGWAPTQDVYRVGGTYS